MRHNHGRLDYAFLLGFTKWRLSGVQLWSLYSSCAFSQVFKPHSETPTMRELQMSVTASSHQAIWL